MPGVSLTSKTVTLRGFNGLKNGVLIKSFDLPSNDPAGGIHLMLDSTVANVRLPHYLSDMPLIPQSTALASWSRAQLHRLFGLYRRCHDRYSRHK